MQTNFLHPGLDTEKQSLAFDNLLLGFRMDLLKQLGKDSLSPSQDPTLKWGGL